MRRHYPKGIGVVDVIGKSFYYWHCHIQLRNCTYTRRWPIMSLGEGLTDDEKAVRLLARIVYEAALDPTTYASLACAEAVSKQPNIDDDGAIEVFLKEIREATQRDIATVLAELSRHEELTEAGKRDRIAELERLLLRNEELFMADCYRVDLATAYGETLPAGLASAMSALAKQVRS